MIPYETFSTTAGIYPWVDEEQWTIYSNTLIKTL